jgi:hypothetical protein
LVFFSLVAGVCQVFWLELGNLVDLVDLVGLVDRVDGVDGVILDVPRDLIRKNTTNKSENVLIDRVWRGRYKGRR